MAPGLLRGEPATAASDVYATGVLLYHLVTQSFPYPGRTIEEVSYAQDEGIRKLLHDARPDLPQHFTRVVEQALAIDPHERFHTAGQRLQALGETHSDSRSRESMLRDLRLKGPPSQETAPKLDVV